MTKAGPMPERKRPNLGNFGRSRPNLGRLSTEFGPKSRKLGHPGRRNDDGNTARVEQRGAVVPQCLRAPLVRRRAAQTPPRRRSRTARALVYFSAVWAARPALAQMSGQFFWGRCGQFWRASDQLQAKRCTFTRATTKDTWTTSILQHCEPQHETHRGCFERERDGAPTSGGHSPDIPHSTRDARRYVGLHLADARPEHRMLEPGERRLCGREHVNAASRTFAQVRSRMCRPCTVPLRTRGQQTLMWRVRVREETDLGRPGRPRTDYDNSHPWHRSSSKSEP